MTVRFGTRSVMRAAPWAVLVVLGVGAAVLVAVFASRREEQPSPSVAQGVLVPAAGTEPCDIHFGWTTARSVLSLELDVVHVTLTLVAVPAGEDVTLGGRPLPVGVGRQTPVAGIPVEFTIGNRDRDILPSGSQPIPYTFLDGSSTITVTTDSTGAATVDVRVASRDPSFRIDAAAEFEAPSGGRSSRTSTFETGPKSKTR